MLKDTVTYLVKQLVAHPEKVQIQEVDAEQGRALKIIVDHEDIGKVIGKDGQSIKSIRSLVALFKAENEPFLDVVIDS
ncbi:MAG: KH domain-containing protein [Candidatus Dependentiae bacterium]